LANHRFTADPEADDTSLTRRVSMYIVIVITVIIGLDIIRIFWEVATGQSSAVLTLLGGLGFLAIMGAAINYYRWWEW